MMSPEDAKRYLDFLENGSREGLTSAELAGVEKADALLVSQKVEYEDVWDLRNAGDALENGTPSKVHGNSKLSTKPQHGYEIYNTETGDVVKTGISGQRMNLNGTSPRANIQVNRLNRGAGKNLYDSTIVATDMPNRLSALEWERENALRLWNEGNSMSLHRRPRPWED